MHEKKSILAPQDRAIGIAGIASCLSALIACIHSTCHLNSCLFEMFQKEDLDATASHKWVLHCPFVTLKQKSNPVTAKHH